MKNLFLSTTLLVVLLPNFGFADCSELAENTATVVHSQIEESPVTNFTSGSHLKYSVMLTQVYDVVIREKSAETFYEVTASGTTGNCKISHITKAGDEQQEDLSSNEELKLENATVSILHINNKKYSIEKGILDAAILATFPIAYNNFPRDKYYHFVAGASASLVANRLCYHVVFKNSEYRKLLSNLCGFGSGVLAGALKELYDSKTGGDVDFNDFVYTAAGGALITLRFTLF